MGSYHPHGDAALYEALVRMAQSFSLRYPLVDGSGNFGSIDGDGAAAMRYTECRLAHISDEMLSEIDQHTVNFQTNYDGTKTEPVVLPARIPNLLINGATGIAVGMATNIPPHNLGEVCEALIKLLDKPALTNAQLCRYIKGPDFPTGGQILNPPEEIKALYKTGSGTIRLRATWEEGPMSRAARTLYVTSIPYAVNKSALIERIAEIVLSRKLPLLVDVMDVSTDDVRIALEIKREADPKIVMAYLFKNTPLQTNFAVNLTCLTPLEGESEGEEVAVPDRLDLRSLLESFLHFRVEVVTRRLEHEREALKKRIHILDGLAAVFDVLDDIIRIIRKSDGKADAAVVIMKRFRLDAEQTDAILELKLYRLAKLEIRVIKEELASKKKRLRQINALLKDEERRRKIVRDEIVQIQKQYAGVKTDKRRTLIEQAEEVTFTEDDFIVDEDNVVIVSRDGWVKRQKEVKDLSTTRLREGDAVLAVLQGSTRATIVFFSNFGVAYTARIIDVPASTGYGEPVQKLFKLRDGEYIVGAFSLDSRVSGDLAVVDKSNIPLVHALAVTSDGYALRFSLALFVEPSTRAGRRFARPAKGAEVVGVAKLSGSEILIVATQNARGLLCPAEQVNYLSGPGRGVILIKLPAKEDRVLGFLASTGERHILRVETNRGAEQTISTAKYKVTSRGGKGHELTKRGKFTRVIPSEIETPEPLVNQ